MDSETIADIIAEMRIFKCRNLETGKPESCSAIANYLADRLEAAHKRDIEDAERRGNHAATKAICETIEKVGPLYDAESVGNAAKLREVCDKMLDLLTAEGFEDGGMSIELDEKQVIMWRNRFRAALAAPDRNCDRFADAESARRAWLYDAENWDGFGSPKLKLNEWLLAPWAERKGEPDGR